MSGALQAPLRRVAAVSMGGLRPEGESIGQVPVWGANGIIGWCTQSNLREPAIVVGQRGSVGTLAVTRPPAWVTNNALIVFPLAGRSERYLFYALQAVQERLRGVSTAIPMLTQDMLRSVPVSHHSVEVERKIAKYLDAETARIDAVIAKKQTLRTRLLERFGSRRSEALLRGIDPVDGSGAIPSGWRVGSLATVARLQRGLDLPDSARRPGRVPIVSSGGRSGWHDVVGIRGPGVITGRYGTVGTVYWEPDGFWPLNTTLYVRDFAGNDPRWVYHLLAALPLDLDSAKSAVTGINRNVVGQLRVPIPPLAEQQRLAIQLDADSERCSQVLAALDQQLALLHERRQALITAAVTGELEIPGVPS